MTRLEAHKTFLPLLLILLPLLTLIATGCQPATVQELPNQLTDDTKLTQDRDSLTTSRDSMELSTSISVLKTNFKQPNKKYYPETWFHLNGKNISQEGLTADLRAINYSGMQGIQLFNKKGPAYPDVPQINILTPEWEQMIAHVADETARLGLNLTFQNCPGWSMAGGPWVPAAEAQRELIHHEFHFSGGRNIRHRLAIAPDYQTADRNYQDIKVLALKTPKDHLLTDLTPIAYDTNNKTVPWLSLLNKTKRVDNAQADESFKTYKKMGIRPVANESTWVTVDFASAITLRSIELPPVRTIFMDRQYPKTNIDILVEAKVNEKWQRVTTLNVPSTHWYDLQYPTTLAVPEITSQSFRLTFKNDPLFLSYIKFNSRGYLHNHEAKASKSSRNLQSDTFQQLSPETTIDSTEVLDISEFMDQQGNLDWQAPKGDWTIIRFGHVNMLRTNRPAEPEATGWETSKLDKEAIENHLRNGMMGTLMRAGGPLDGHKIHGMLIDSWESYVPTWTMKKERLAEEFRNRRGYDMTPYLAATLGYVVDSVDVSNKFLRDLRATMDDLYVEKFFKHFRTVAHDMGAKVYTEGAVGETLPGDPLRYYGVSDFPMTEFWYPKAPSNQKEAKPIYAAASAYHLYDKPFLAAEAATQLDVGWNESPKDIQYLINENFAKGVNHLVFHTFSHIPQTDVLPGSSFGGNIGFPLLRTQTWWRHTPTWMLSLARAQYMLQQGEFVADVLWYLGDEFDRHPFDTAPFPDGYKFDYLNAELLHNKVKVTDGQLYVEGAGNYKIIMLRDSQRMLLSTAEKLKELVSQGAIVLGNKPVNSPSLMDDDHDLSQLKKIADELWGNTPLGVKSVGKGRVYWGQSLEQVLESEKIQADVQVPKQTDVRWLHRSTEEAEIYYVTNQHNSALDVSITFREGAGEVEIWDIDSGKVHPAQLVTRSATNNSSNVLVQLPPHGSQFVVFNKTKKPKAEYHQLLFNQQTVLSAQADWFKLYSKSTSPFQIQGPKLVTDNAGAYKLASDIQNVALRIARQVVSFTDNNWQLHFTAGWDTPETISLTSLRALNTHSNPAIKHYSGSVIYDTYFEFDNNTNYQMSLLDLGQVYDIAEVWLNGKKVATRIAPPYRYEVTDHLRVGKNHLKIVVTNTWRNQLIFDNQRAPDNKKTWTTNPPKQDEAALEPSGLVGPVSLINLNSYRR